MNEESAKPLEGSPQPGKGKRRGRVRRWLRRVSLGLVVLLAVVIGLSALSNVLLPSQSPTIERLSDLDKARLAEAFHLRQTLGDAVWPGWAAASIPAIQYNEQYAFLVGYPDPPAGWLKMPQRMQRGGPWEPVPADTFDGRPYWRQRLSDPDVRPEAFTVLVGERWTASMTTKDWTEIGLGNEIRDDLPGVLKVLVPYRAFGRIFNSDWHVCAVLHESFHAYQGMIAPDRLAEAEGSMSVADRYPWDDEAFGNDWQVELDLLADGLLATSQGQAAEQARRFLVQRQKRRDAHGLNAELVDFERQREWEEGLAKYVELAAWRVAATTPDYRPVTALDADSDFRHFKTFDRRWSQEVAQIRRQARAGENRFYYSGMAQAFLLDRLSPGWKANALSDVVFLEDLLGQALPPAN